MHSLLLKNNKNIYIHSKPGQAVEENIPANSNNTKYNSFGAVVNSNIRARIINNALNGYVPRITNNFGFILSPNYPSLIKK